MNANQDKTMFYAEGLKAMGRLCSNAEVRRTAGKGDGKQPRMNANERESEGGVVMREDNTLPFEFGVAEIQDDPDLMTGDFEIVEHLSAFTVGNGFNDLGVDNNRAKSDQIGHILANFDLLVTDVIMRLLGKRDFAQAELNDQGVFVRFFVETMSKGVMHFQRATHNLKDLIFQQQLVRIPQPPLFRSHRRT